MWGGGGGGGGVTRVLGGGGGGGGGDVARVWGWVVDNAPHLGLGLCDELSSWG